MFIKESPHWLRKVEAPSQTFILTIKHYEVTQVSGTFKKSLNLIMATMQRII